jgi:hypothetical protein
MLFTKVYLFSIYSKCFPGLGGHPALPTTAGIAEGRVFYDLQLVYECLLNPKIITFREKPFKTLSAFVEVQ